MTTYWVLIEKSDWYDVGGGFVHEFEVATKHAIHLNEIHNKPVHVYEIVELTYEISQFAKLSNKTRENLMNEDKLKYVGSAVNGKFYSN